MNQQRRLTKSTKPTKQAKERRQAAKVWDVVNNKFAAILLAVILIQALALVALQLVNLVGFVWQ